MMIKLLCSCLVIMGCGYLGIVFASRFDTGIKQLSEFISALRLLEFEITMNNSVLSDAMVSVAGSQNGIVRRIFIDVSDELRNRVGKKPDEIWTTVIEKYKPKLCLKDNDYSAFQEFFVCLGGGTRPEEAGNIKIICEKLRLAEEEAIETKAKNSKLYKSFGFVGGILITVLLF